jgi:hypothetical protein
MQWQIHFFLFKQWCSDTENHSRISKARNIIQKLWLLISIKSSWVGLVQYAIPFHPSIHAYTIQIESGLISQVTLQESLLEVAYNLVVLGFFVSLWSFGIYVGYFVFLFQLIIKKKKEGEEKRMTQEEMLLEAAETGLPCFLFTILKRYCSAYSFIALLLSQASWPNPTCLGLKGLVVVLLSMFLEIMELRNLERVLAREEEVKKKVVHKDTYDGPIVRFCKRW